MKTQNKRRSENIEDRRGQRGPGGRLKLGVGGIAIAGLLLVLGVDPGTVLQMFVGGDGGGASITSAEEDELADFVSVVLADTETTWNQQLPAQMGIPYEEPVLVLFTGQVASACGHQSAAVGPFYCPADHQVYIDLSFYHQLREQLGAPGDFAQAYVIAHEVGHHLQNLTGVSDRVNAQRQRVGETEANALSVRMELQADCYAGIWARDAERSRDMIEVGDIDEAIHAAHQIGDDTLQRNAGRRVVPEAFTHGTAEQRARWFRTGYQTGQMAACDTFSASRL